MRGAKAKVLRDRARGMSVGAGDRRYVVRDHSNPAVPENSPARPNFWIFPPLIGSKVPRIIPRNRRQVMLEDGCTRRVYQRLKRWLRP